MYNCLLKVCCGLAAAVFFAPYCGRASASVSEKDEAMAAIEACEAYLADHPFNAKSRGTVKARVFGVPYKVTTVGSRNVIGQTFDSADESRSAFINIAFTRACDGERYTVTTAEYRGGAFKYGSPVSYTYDEFVSRCGDPPVSLTKFDWSHNVLSAERTGECEYTYELSVDAAATPARQMTAIMGGSRCEYESVRLTVATDGRRPLRVKTDERFSIDKFGGTGCVAEFTEDFYY